MESMNEMKSIATDSKLLGMEESEHSLYGAGKDSYWGMLQGRSIQAKRKNAFMGRKDVFEAKFNTFSSSHKEMEKLNLRIKEKTIEIEQIEVDLKTIEEKQSLISMKANECYEYIIRNLPEELEEKGLVELMQEMCEMDFNLPSLLFPVRHLGDESRSFCIK